MSRIGTRRCDGSGAPMLGAAPLLRGALAATVRNTLDHALNRLFTGGGQATEDATRILRVRKML